MIGWYRNNGPQGSNEFLVGKAADRQVARIVGLVGSHQGGVGLEAEAAVIEHVLKGEFGAVDVGGGAVDTGGDGEDGRLSGGGIQDAIDGLQR